MSDLVLNRCKRLCEALEENYISYSSESYSKYTFTIHEARKYYKIWMNISYDLNDRTLRTLPLFVDKITGDVFKPASVHRPAKHARFNLMNDESFANILSFCDWSYIFADS